MIISQCRVCGNMSTATALIGTKHSSPSNPAGLQSRTTSVARESGLQEIYTSLFTPLVWRRTSSTPGCSPGRGGSTIAETSTSGVASYRRRTAAGRVSSARPARNSAFSISLILAFSFAFSTASLTSSKPSTLHSVPRALSCLAMVSPMVPTPQQTSRTTRGLLDDDGDSSGVTVFVSPCPSHSSGPCSSQSMAFWYSNSVVAMFVWKKLSGDTAKLSPSSSILIFSAPSRCSKMGGFLESPSSASLTASFCCRSMPTILTPSPNVLAIIISSASLSHSFCSGVSVLVISITYISLHFSEWRTTAKRRTPFRDFREYTRQTPSRCNGITTSSRSTEQNSFIASGMIATLLGSQTRGSFSRINFTNPTPIVGHWSAVVSPWISKAAGSGTSANPIVNSHLFL
mmetsp:Transcript_41523/g.99559  ORF Transcript_41523/g.99559 Transcript_41523/m.99559 type:complete len:401 (+) Transcript_41523:204-1406(+)